MDASKRRLEKQDFPLWPGMGSVGERSTLAMWCLALCTGGYMSTQEIDMFSAVILVLSVSCLCLPVCISTYVSLCMCFPVCQPLHALPTRGKSRSGH